MDEVVATTARLRSVIQMAEIVSIIVALVVVVSVASGWLPFGFVLVATPLVADALIMWVQQRACRRAIATYTNRREASDA